MWNTVNHDFEKGANHVHEFLFIHLHRLCLGLLVSIMRSMPVASLATCLVALACSLIMPLLFSFWLSCLFLFIFIMISIIDFILPLLNHIPHFQHDFWRVMPVSDFLLLFRRKLDSFRINVIFLTWIRSTWSLLSRRLPLFIENSYFIFLILTYFESDIFSEVFVQVLTFVFAWIREQSEIAIREHQAVPESHSI